MNRSSASEVEALLMCFKGVRVGGDAFKARPMVGHRLRSAPRLLRPLRCPLIGPLRHPRLPHRRRCCLELVVKVGREGEEMGEGWREHPGGPPKGMDTGQEPVQQKLGHLQSVQLQSQWP